MSDLAIGTTGFVVLLVLIGLRMPIGVGMLMVGALGYALIAGTTALLSFFKTQMYWQFTSFDFSVLPLFLLMGNFAARAGITSALFRAVNSWMGHFRGGIAMAAIGGGAVVGAGPGSPPPLPA